MDLDLIFIEAAAQVLMLAVAYALWRLPGRMRARRSREATRKARQAQQAAQSAEVGARMRARFERETRGYMRPMEKAVHRGEAILPAATAGALAPRSEPGGWPAWPTALPMSASSETERVHSPAAIVSGGGGDFSGGGASGGRDSGSSCSDSGSSDSGSSSSCSSSD